MPFLLPTPAYARTPELIVLPDGRKRVISYIRCNTTGIVPPEVDYAVKTAYPWTDAPTGWTGLVLTYKKLSDNTPINLSGGRDIQPWVELTWEQISTTGETQTGGTPENHLPDGRYEIETSYVMFSTSTYTPLTPGSSSTTFNGQTFYLFEETSEDDGTLRNIKRRWQTAGTVSTDDQSLQGGTLLLKKIESFKTVPSTPSGYTIVGTPVQNPNGYPIYTYTYAKGSGLAQENIRIRSDGLREVTDIALGTKSTPTGVVIRDDYELRDGYTVYTVTCVQSASGASPIGTSYSVERYVPFTYPGRAKPFAGSYGFFTLLDVFRSPPVQALVKATVTVTYQTSNTVGTISDLWNPTDWAVMQANWVGFGNNPHAIVESLPGYRATTTTAVTATCSGVAPIDVTIFGNPIYGGTTGSIQVYGGPPDPGGNTYTLHVEVDDRPAFQDVSGTLYYRKTAITATIPSQAALPV